jgi:phosphoglycolate phosphatase-like HAD superfamily hydrolase
MRQFNEYELIVFDCDGVLIDSNDLKVEAMGKALEEAGVVEPYVEKCKMFFTKNFGKSRFYHIDYFVENILKLKDSEVSCFKDKLLSAYSKQCKTLYLTANMTPLVEELLEKNKAIKYVASGSEQGELRDVFKLRQLTTYFEEILGSPEKKSTHVTNILKLHKNLKTVMIGDAVSDLEAARNNGIDFVFYSPFSNVEAKMRELCIKYEYRTINSFEEIME